MKRLFARPITPGITKAIHIFLYSVSLYAWILSSAEQGKKGWQQVSDTRLPTCRQSLPMSFVYLCLCLCFCLYLVCVFIYTFIYVLSMSCLCAKEVQWQQKPLTGQGFTHSSTPTSLIGAKKGEGHETWKWGRNVWCSHKTRCSAASTNRCLPLLVVERLRVQSISHHALHHQLSCIEKKLLDIVSSSPFVVACT